MFRFLWQNVVFYVFEKTMWYSMICDKNAVFQVSSMVLIHHKYNSKWGRKAKFAIILLLYLLLYLKNELIQTHMRRNTTIINELQLLFTGPL